jgi:UDP-N-acetylglucosamine 1-carboxyvinyltransferase
MTKYIITGGYKLQGEIAISGNKNSILPCMAAALLTNEKIVLTNVPEISDVNVFLEIFERLGIAFTKSKGTIVIEAKNIKSTKLPDDLSKRLRASVILVGPILARMKKVSFCFPGGDLIGRRNIESHLNGFVAMGAKLTQKDLDYSLKLVDLRDSNDIFLEEASVTATENLILSSSLGKGIVRISNCASEPHIVDLCLLLKQMGADISGIGTSTLIIKRVNKLHKANFRIGLDYIELGTWAIAAALTKGRIKLTNIDKTNLDSVLIPLSRFGVKYSTDQSSITVWADKLTSVEKVITNIWPGFPADLMSPLIVLATQSKGVTLCHDWMYESRMFFVDKLISMGANITIADPHRVLVYGPSKLRCRELESPDIRAGMALLLASLIAKGVSTINKAELIERGYEDVVNKLISLGARVERV